jgi:predicted RNase H-like nuclease
LARNLGVDGVCGGWVAAWIDDAGNCGFESARELAPLLAAPHARAMIDMPIGLPASGRRVCDSNARRLIGAPVFLGARRNIWEFRDQASANRYYWRHEGPRSGVSCQLWNIRDKIREVDDLMTPERQQTIGEAHPELVFWRLNDRLRLAPKKSAMGRGQRIGILAAHGFADITQWLDRRRGTGIGRDDLIDACACAVAARDSTERLGGDEFDARGLRMEINF